MPNGFVQVTDSNNVVQVINIQQIVRVHQKEDHWGIIFAGGDPISLSELEAEKLFKSLDILAQDGIS